MDDPVCLTCYNKELLAWLRDNVKHKYMINYIIRKVSRKLSLSVIDLDYCILCRRHGFFISKKDYFSEVKRILQEINISDGVINNFSKIFYQDNIYYHIRN